MFDFLSLKLKTFGLDISDLSLKIVGLKKKKRFFDLDFWTEQEIKEGTIVEGEIKNEKELINALEKSIEKIKKVNLKKRKAVVSLPEKKAFFEIIKMPRMTKQELEKAIFFELENYIPFSANDVYMDFQIISPPANEKKREIDVLVGAMPKKVVDPYIFCLKEAGLSPIVLEVESQAISRALIKEGFSSETVLIIDFGRSRSSLIIFSGSSLVFTFSFPISSFMLTKVISDSLKIDINEGEKIKRKFGLSGFFKSKKELKGKEGKKAREAADAMIPILTDLTDQIKKYIDYYQSHICGTKFSSCGRRIKKLILSGRGSNLKGFDDFLFSELKIPVEKGNPWINIISEKSKTIPPLSLSDSLGYTTALGLALRGIKHQIYD